MKITKYRGETITLATTVGFNQVKGIPPWANAVDIEAPSATKENISVGFGPKIAAVYFFDASQPNGARWIDLTDALTDRNASTGSGPALNSMTSSDYVYVGFTSLAAGVAVDIGSANSNTSDLNASRSAGPEDAPTWTTLTITDNTDSGSNVTFGQDGAITWTVPQGWRSVRLDLDGEKSKRLHFVRFSPVNTLSASVTWLEVAGMANTIVDAANETAEGIAYALIQSNAQSLPPYRFVLEKSRFGAIEVKSTSITSAANLNWLRLET